MEDGSTKVCGRCGVEYPATTEFFYERGGGRDGKGPPRLTSPCKTCACDKSRKCHAANTEAQFNYICEGCGVELTLRGEASNTAPINAAWRLFTQRLPRGVVSKGTIGRALIAVRI